MKNLIRYSESTENFLSDYCRPFFHSSSSSGRKFGPKIGNFDLILDDPFDHILPISARMTLKLWGNDVSDDLNRFRMPSHDFGSFKKYFWAKMANLWMIQDSHFWPHLSGICSYDLETFRKWWQWWFRSIQNAFTWFLIIQEAFLSQNDEFMDDPR